MQTTRQRAGRAAPAVVLILGSLIVVSGLAWLLQSRDELPGDPTLPVAGGPIDELFIYCAAGMRYPMEEIASQYKREFGVNVQLQYGGSNTLLSQIKVANIGDLYLAGDSSYIQQAVDGGLMNEVFDLANMKPVIAVLKENTSVKSIEDLASPQHRVCLGNPGAAAIGKKVRRLLTRSGHWERVNKNVTENGVFKPTVNEVANDIKLKSVDAGVIWDATAAQYTELKQVATPELDAGDARVQMGVLTSTKKPTAALHFARYAAARDKGLRIFREKGFRVVNGDVWAHKPELTFFAGSVNRRALEPVIHAFESREGVKVNTIYNGCGILTAQMKTILETEGSGFPDTYMACDVYYLDAVKEFFEPGIHVSETDIVICVQRGNPKNIRTLKDLASEGIRVAIGEPRECTIGVLSRRLLQDAGLYEQMLKTNIKAQTPSSAMLLPAVTSASADAALVYRTDASSNLDKIEIVPIQSKLAKAIQPFSVARQSQFKQLSQRLFETVAASRRQFEEAGFRWRLAPQASN